MDLRPACRGRSAPDGCRAYAAEPPKLSNKVWVAGCLTPRFIACQSIHSLGCPPPDRGTELGGLLSSRSPPPPKIAPRCRVISRRMSTGLDGVGLDGAGAWTRAEGGPRTDEGSVRRRLALRAVLGQRRDSFGGPEPVRGTATANQGRSIHGASQTTPSRR